MKRFLTTGISSGFGKYAYEHVGGLGITRKTANATVERFKKKGVDVIIHCAVNSARVVDAENFQTYFNDNVSLTKKMLSIPHRKFIFMSTVDVYPRDSAKHGEREVLCPSKIKGNYALSKRLSEILVQKHAKNFAILRASSLLGRYSKPNSIIKIVRNRKPAVSLTADSELNCVRHETVLRLIRKIVQHDLRGIFNVTSSRNIPVREIAQMAGRKIRFGHYRYRVGRINNQKVAAILPDFKKTSRQVINQFILDPK